MTRLYWCSQHELLFVKHLIMLVLVVSHNYNPISAWQGPPVSPSVSACARFSQPAKRALSMMTPPNLLVGSNKSALYNHDPSNTLLSSATVYKVLGYGTHTNNMLFSPASTSSFLSSLSTFPSWGRVPKVPQPPCLYMLAGGGDRVCLRAGAVS